MEGIREPTQRSCLPYSEFRRWSPAGCNARLALPLSPIPFAHRPMPLSTPLPRRIGVPRTCLIVGLGLTLLACSPKPDPRTEEDLSKASIEDTLARDRVAAMVAATRYDQARSVLAPLVSRENAQAEDLLRATVIELKDGNLEAARGFLERAAQEQQDATVHFLRGRMEQLEGKPEAADHYRKALALAPGDLASQYALAQVLDQQDQYEEAIELCEQLKGAGIEDGGPWYVSSVYLLYRIHNWLNEDEEALRKYTDLWAALQQRGLRAVKESEINEGTLARILPPPAIGNQPEGESSTPVYEAAEIIAPELGGGAELLAEDLNGDRRTDLVSVGPAGVRVALQASDGSFHTTSVWEEAAHTLRTLDLHKDGTLDLVFIGSKGLVVLEADGEGAQVNWSPSPLVMPTVGAKARDLEPVDADHDGDLDLLVVGANGIQLLRNDGAGRAPEGDDGDEPLPRGTFTDVSAETGLPKAGDWRWCAIEDLDGDQDVDLLCGGPGLLWVGSSLRGGRFVDVSDETFGGADLPSQPLFADVDGDARVDALCPSPTDDPAAGRLYLQQSDGAMEPGVRSIPSGAQLVEVDLDLNGTVDALWPGADCALQGFLDVGLAGERAGRIGAGPAEGQSLGPLVVADLESGYGDTLAWELLHLEADGVHVQRSTGPMGKAIRIRFKGKKDNSQGIGAVVELRAGSLYRRHFWRGTTTLYGLGSREFVEVLRVTWPNGVVSSDLDVEAGNQILEGATGLGIQTEGLVGSCPFLYTWNGETFEFVSDVLGITPLGLPMAPGMLVPPDHDEYVLVRGEQLVERDGELHLQFTEELREVTYLDHVRLDVVDHPAGTEVQPNERFTFPPFPEAHTHVMGTLHSPQRAMGSDGEDWTAALAEIDNEHAAPFERLADGQFYGLADHHWLELEFDAQALAQAEPDAPLRLVCTGWFLWTDASVNMASARTPGVEFVPPMILVPDGDDWSPTGPPVGFPAGKTKTMVLDVSSILKRDDPRLRISSTLCLYWDSIRLSVGEDATQVTTALPVQGARLWARGFSAPLPSESDTSPEMFDWDTRSEQPRWNQHPGAYTRYGDVLTLLETVDDQFVIMGAGDALELRFDAGDLPPLPEGWTRDYLVYLDGWAKDRDPNTLSALEVEPLPHHGMGIYPPPPGLEYPDDGEHRTWREEWNTRMAYPHVIPLSPRREREWSE